MSPKIPNPQFKTQDVCHFKNQIIITNNIITIQNTNIHPLLNIIKNIEFTVHNTKQTIQNTEYKHLKGRFRRELVRSQPFQHHKQIPNRPLSALKKLPLLRMIISVRSVIIRHESCESFPFAAAFFTHFAVSQQKFNSPVNYHHWANYYDDDNYDDVNCHLKGSSKLILFKQSCRFIH